MQNNNLGGMNPSQLQNMQRSMQMHNQQNSQQSGQTNPYGMMNNNNNNNSTQNNMMGMNQNMWGGNMNAGGSSMDASNTSSARLMASMLGGGGPGSTAGSSQMQNMQALMNNMQGMNSNNRSMPAAQNAMLQQFNNMQGGGGATNNFQDSMMQGNGSQLQQHLLMQQQQRRQNNPNMMGGSFRDSSNLMNMMQNQMPTSNMSQRNAFGNTSNSQFANAMMQQNQINSGQQAMGQAMGSSNPGLGHASSRGQLGQSMNASTNGQLSEQQLRVHQQNLLRNSQMDQSQTSQRDMNNMANNMPSNASQGSFHSSHMNRQASQHMMNQSQNGMRGMASSHSMQPANDMSQRNQGGNANFQAQRQRGGAGGVLEGALAGGWQSNADLPDRRKVIFHILEIIRRMRLNNDNLSDSQRLPHMAKSLEEHLYRSAQSKEEYLEYSTLRTRLQAIAQGLDVHRIPTSSGSIQASLNFGDDASINSRSTSNSPFPAGDRPSGNQAWNMQQQHQDQGGMHGGDWSGGSANIGGQMAIRGAAAMNQGNQGDHMDMNHMIQHPNQGMNVAIPSNGPAVINPDYPNTPKYQDSEAAAKNKRAIQQQQQRLLLLRHASKCKAGPNCTTKFCPQMLELWKHLRECRSRNCKTPHCVSSRCVLNHYRICNREGKTSTCEVCGPVMNRIREVEHLSSSNHDPLFRDSDLDDPSSDSEPIMLRPVSNQASAAGPGREVQGSQLERIQMEQAKLKAQLEMLKNLQKQQEQLLAQQTRLQQQLQSANNPDSPQAQQLQQQQLLLQGLQKRCQQQQWQIQQEIQSQQNGLMIGNGIVENNAGKGQPVVQPAGQPTGGNAAVQRPSMHGSIQGKVGGVNRRPSLGKTLQQVEDALDATETSKQGRNVVEDRELKPEESQVYGTRTEPFKDQGTSLIPYLSKDSINRHLHSLNKKIRLSSRTVAHKCMPLIDGLITHQFGWVFNDPVDPVTLNLPDYYDIVKNPMHLALVKKKLENAIYPEMESFARDVRLVFENAIVYNGEESEVGGIAQTMIDEFNAKYSSVVKDIESAHTNLESQGEICSLCGDQRKKFEPTVLYCQGRCGMQRIKRQATYFTDHTKANHWCQDCFELIGEDDPILLEDGSEVKKSDLQEFKNDAQPEEGWVNCDECHSWVHQICALFNGRQNKSDAKFSCPNCLVRNMPSEEPLVEENQVLKPADLLPKSRLSDFIENGLAVALEKAYKKRADEMGISVAAVEKAEPLTVRVIMNVRKKHFVGPQMKEFYKDQGCPSAFPVTSKCVSLFQKVHGIDTFLFALYVYEYGQDAPAPNRRRVYVSYLDSVQYFEPKCYRTTVYQAVLVEYLRYVKERGFHTAHIWSCPPTPGDDYIFYNHPNHQKIPREDMLRSWYHSILKTAESEGIVIRSTTLYDEYFTDESGDKVPAQTKYATCLPYFEGDYIPGEIETVISKLKPDAPSDEKRDAVMTKIGNSLKKMKDNFMVVHLRNRRFAAAVERGDDVSAWIDESDDETIRGKRAKISSKDSSGVPPDTEESVKATTDTSQESRPLEQPENPSSERAKISSKDSSGVPPDTEESVKATTETSQESRPLEQPENPSSERVKDSNEATETTMAEMSAAIDKQMSGMKRSAERTVSDTSDSDPSVENDLFENRQQFLNYCQTNHCQFDELRRAKHSTMMVLFQLHNPLAPKFLHQCSACYNEITHGTRYHCNSCRNFDLCQDCYEPVTTGLWARRDKRFAHDKSHKFTSIDMEDSEEKQKLRAERQMSLKAYVEILEHAATCEGCDSQNCARIKQLFDHVQTCSIRPKKDCRLCARMLSLCALHSRDCSADGSCPIPFCDRIRERNQRVRKQQQLMDDRRRQAQNELYHTGNESVGTN